MTKATAESELLTLTTHTQNSETSGGWENETYKVVAAFQLNASILTCMLTR